MDSKKDFIHITDKDQANQIFKEMESREVDRLRSNYDEIKNMLTKVGVMVYSENRVSTPKELTDLKDLINACIGAIRKIKLTTNEETHFGNESLVKRNSEYKREAIKSLKSDLKVVKSKIKKTEVQIIGILPKNENVNLRRPVAFCFCLLYKDGKYDVSTMTKNGLRKYIADNFKDNFKKLSAQNVVNTLLGYDLSKAKERSLLSYSDKTKSWHFQDDNYKYMIGTFPDDYNKALKMFERFK